MGLQHPAPQPFGQRDLVPDRDAAGHGTTGVPHGFAFGHAGRHRGAARFENLRRQAVRHVQRHIRRAHGSERRHRRRRVDAKFGLTQGLTADVTYNTDFAQVEADEQQINLTRFSLFFPEKREFFLENAGTFSFGGVSLGGFGGGETPILFYSRRIGLEGGAAVPLRAGGRVTGRVGPFNLGLLTIQADEVPETGTPSTNFSVVRLKRDVLRRSTIGVMATGRSVDRNGREPNYAYGIDGTFGFFDSLTINTYWARTETEGLSGDNMSYRAQLNYNGDLYGLAVGASGSGRQLQS